MTWNDGAPSRGAAAAPCADSATKQTNPDSNPDAMFNGAPKSVEDRELYVVSRRRSALQGATGKDRARGISPRRHSRGCALKCAPAKATQSAGGSRGGGKRNTTPRGSPGRCHSTGTSCGGGGSSSSRSSWAADSSSSSQL